MNEADAESRPAATPPTLALAYAIPPARRRFSWLICITGGVILLFLELMNMTFVPAIEQVFADFHLELPLPTRILLAASKFLSGWGWLGVIAAPVALGFLSPRVFRREAPVDMAAYVRLMDRMLAVVVVVLAVLIMLVIAAIFLLLPYMTLVQGISRHN